MWQRRTPLWICNHVRSVLMREHCAEWCCIFARGLCVVCSTNPGNAKASNCGAGNRYRPCAFLFPTLQAKEKGPAAALNKMSDTSALQRHYDYWDDYVSHWFMCDMSCCSHLPEPWWGWSPLKGNALHSVVINLNPGKGGAEQTRDSLLPILGNETYCEAMLSGDLPKHLPETHAWHSNHRAKSILSRLAGLDISDKDYIFHHLSIELSPLHSATSQEVNSYVAANLDDVLEHSLLFAAEASRFVKGPLQGVVIVRCSALRFLKMFSNCGITPCSPEQDVSKSPFWCRFNTPGFEDVKFVCVWGARNDLPKNNIELIINTIINNLKV